MNDMILRLWEIFLRGAREGGLFVIVLYPIIDALDALWRSFKYNLLGDSDGKERRKDT